MIDLIRWELWWLLPVTFHARGECECSWCEADDAEDASILAWETWTEVARKCSSG